MAEGGLNVNRSQESIEDRTTDHETTLQVIIFSIHYTITYTL